MSTVTSPVAPINGESPPIPIQGVVLSEADYRTVLAERLEMAGLRERVAELEAKYEVMRGAYKSVHHAYYELVKDKLPPEDPNWTPPPPEDTVDVMDLMAELNRE